jgi:myo-inositol-1(or 4)-monophosphatase
MISEEDKLVLLDIAETAVGNASDLLRTRKPTQLRLKGDRDLASDVDLAIERAVRAYLRQKTPDIGFLGEEEGDHGPQDEMRWVLDPIDGTVNFLHGYPLCAIALALVSGDTTLAAVVELPFLSMRYTAIRGNGSYADGRRLRGSDTAALGDALISLDQFTFGPGAELTNSKRSLLLSRLASEVQRVRIIGASAIDLVWTAEGRQDACVMLGNKPWDTAAGVLIAQEAGLRVSDPYGEEYSVHSRAVVAVVPQLEPPLMEIIRMTLR